MKRSLLHVQDPRESRSDPITDVQRAIVQLVQPHTPWSEAGQAEALRAVQREQGT